MVGIVPGSKRVDDLHAMICYKIRYKLKNAVLTRVLKMKFKRIPDQMNDKYLTLSWI